ncbi:rhomboid-related protein 3 isoform 3-T3 [Hipposideros larvatus]
MGEHPSPGPAVAACAEAERIEELDPEADERPPAAPEDHWKVLFDQFDPGNTGYISTGKFRSLLESHSSKLDPHKREVLLALADSHADGQICYQDFVNLMSNKRSNSFRQAILQGNRRLCSKALLEEKGLNLSQRLIRHVAYETLPREIDRKWYYDSYTCCPPPWFMITVTLLEVAFFLYNGVSLDQFVLQVTHPRYLKNSLVYHPQLRAQAWRYLTYIFMHAGIEHLGLNVVLQLLVGVPLEMVHGATRIGLVYVAGVVAGSLAVSVADMTAPVVGSSGGVYALVSAHLANIVMIAKSKGTLDIIVSKFSNWKDGSERLSDLSKVTDKVVAKSGLERASPENHLGVVSLYQPVTVVGHRYSISHTLLCLFLKGHIV